MAYGSWPKYVSVADRKAKAQKKLAALKKKGHAVVPVEIQGRTIARSFWGKAWCEHLEKFSDYQNRLPRGRTYVRNGSVCHLEISKGSIKAMVAGSSIYNIHVKIDPLPKAKWKKIQQRCAGSVGSMVELLQGKLSDNVMRSVTDKDNGLFPNPSEIDLHCNCPDWAELCKHLAAVLYGVGARLDEYPQLLFELRGVDQRDLIADELSIDTESEGLSVSGDLAELFGIELDMSPAVEPKKITKNKAAAKRQPKCRAQAKKTTKKPATIAGAGSYTAQALEDFRGSCALTEQDFARLTGKALATVKKWENQPGVIALSKKSIEALQTVMKMNKQEAHRALKKLT